MIKIRVLSLAVFDIVCLLFDFIHVHIFVSYVLDNSETKRLVLLFNIPKFSIF